jgi:hypothetical protein
MAVAAPPTKSRLASLRDIERYMAAPPETSVVMEIDADLARAILDKYNLENRGLKPHKIRPLIGDLQAGHWLVTGETIKFSDRRLLDGQNRLTACAESGVPIRTHVVFGVPDEAFSIIDTGAPRTAGDVLICAGHKNPNELSHAVRRLHSWKETPGSRSVLQLSPNQVLTLLDTEYRDLPKHMKWGRELQAQTKLTASRGLTLHYAFEAAMGKAAADTFLRAWIDNTDAQQAMVLRRRLAQMQSVIPGALPTNVVYALAIKAFARFSQGLPVDVATLRFGEDEAFPVVPAAK